MFKSFSLPPPKQQTNKQTSKQTTNKQLIEPSLWWASSWPLPKQRVRRRTCRQLWTTRSWTCSKSHPTPATSCLNYLNMFLLSVYHHFIVIVSHLWSHVPPCADSSVWGDVNLVCLTVEPGESMWKWKYVKVKVCKIVKVKVCENEMKWKWNKSHWSRTGWKLKRDNNERESEKRHLTARPKSAIAQLPSLFTRMFFVLMSLKRYWSFNMEGFE